MSFALVSDLHLGILSGIDVARDPSARARLVEAVSSADHVVLLGDVLEMRERRAADLLEIARPLFQELGEVTAGGRLTVVPGNHDHGLAAPWLGRMRLDGRELEAEGVWEVQPGDGLLGRLAAYLPGTHLTVAYPGLRLRPDVYVTHGHYLDIPLTVPRIESVAASIMARLGGRGRHATGAADYEAALSPLYGLLGGFAETAADAALRRGGSLSRSVWRQASGRRRLGGLAMGRVAIPGAVFALNRLGAGPLEAAISGEHLRRGGLNAMRRVAGVLAPDAEHVIFGHTHRAGPLPGDDLAEWRAPGGPSLWNSGCWCHEPVFLGPPGDPGPYWPGTVIRLGEIGPPRVENALRGATLPALAA